MRAPWIQVAMEVIEVSAPELAVELNISEEKAGWGLLKLIPWALMRCPDDEPPSENDIVEGPTAARQITKITGYKGSADAYVAACERIRFPMLERLPNGVRIRGLDRYDPLWGSNHREAWKAWQAHREGKGPRPFSHRNPHVNPKESPCPDPDPDPDPDLLPTPKPLPSQNSDPPPSGGGEEIWGTIATTLAEWMITTRTAQAPPLKPNRKADLSAIREWAIAWVLKLEPNDEQLARMRGVFEAYLQEDFVRRRGASLAFFADEGIWRPRWDDACVAAGAGVKVRGTG